MWIQTDGGISFIVLTARRNRGRRVSLLVSDDGVQEWLLKSFILDPLNDAIQSIGRQNADGRCSLLCIYEASPPCGASCGPPACTAPWRAFARVNIPPSDTRTPSSRRGCGRCWCAARRVTKRSSLRDHKEAALNTTCTFMPLWVWIRFTGFTHAAWMTPSSITLDSYYASVNRTQKLQKLGVFSGSVCFSRKRNFLKSQQHWSGRVFISHSSLDWRIRM